VIFRLIGCKFSAHRIESRRAIPETIRVIMRTTLDIDQDVLLAVKELARYRRTTAGKVLSDLARKALSSSEKPQVRNGVPLMPRRPEGSPRMTMEMVNALRDEE
jgi:hypothetical protein